MAEDLLDTIGQLFGTIRGGLAYAVIFVGALLAATTGVVAASVISMGLISLPIMLRYGYDRRARHRRDRCLRHAGADHPAVARPDRHGRPARPLGRRHVRGRVHSRARAGGALCGYVFAVTMCLPKAAPAFRPRRRPSRTDGRRGAVAPRRRRRRGVIAYFTCADRRKRGRRLRRADVSIGIVVAFVARSSTGCCGSVCSRASPSRSIFVMVPPLALIFLVLGTIFIGVATPTEGGAMGAAGALILALSSGG